MFYRELQGRRLSFADSFYIIPLTDIVLFFYSAIFPAKCLWSSKIEIFVIIWAI